MILSFHPCFVADAQIILADRKLSADDRRLIQTADAIILPQSCSAELYRACKSSSSLLFPDYGIRFKYPGKVGQSILFETLRIPHPATKRWPSVKKFRDRQKEESALPHDIPFFLKADKSHEGEGVHFVDGINNLEKLSDNLMNPSPLMGEVYPPLAAPKFTCLRQRQRRPGATRGKGGGGKDGEHSSTSLFPPPLYPLPPGEGTSVVGQSLETALGRLEKAGPEGFISQKAIPCGGNVLRAVVLHKRIISYWKRPGRPDGVITTVNHGARVDKEWKPELQEKGRAQAQWISEKTGINLAAFDFVFDPGNPDLQPFILEINYYFGRRGLGGSLRYYRLLLKAIREWLKENGFDGRPVKLV
jgi:hypothetical protein